MKATPCFKLRSTFLATTKHIRWNHSRSYQSIRETITVPSVPAATRRIVPRTNLGPANYQIHRTTSRHARLGKKNQGEEHLASQISCVLYILPLIAVGAYILYESLLHTISDPSEHGSRIREFVEDKFDPEMDALPGRPGNLTPEQEEKMLELWKLVLQVSGVTDDDSTTEAASSDAPLPLQAHGKTATMESEKPKKKRLGIFKKKNKKDKENVAPAGGGEKSITLLDGAKEDDPDDKYGQNKQFRETLANRTPASIRESLWTMVKMDHPDQLVLRFLRARKWDVQKALVMLVSTMKWRQDVKVDDDIMTHGEEWMLLEEMNNTNEKEKKYAQDFLAQMRLGKSFNHGVDKEGRPISVIRVRLHKAGDQSNESLERFTIYVIETTRLLLAPPADTGAVIFDMTGFTLANMDYTPVKFMIQCFEANYPESLGVVLVHKAPWVFQGIWKIIRGWLDPVVASKVHFTNNVKDMSEFIPTARIPIELDGEDKWTYKYVEPVIGENEKMNDTVTRDRLLEEREVMYEEFEQNTLQWIMEKDAEKRAAVKADRNTIAKKMRDGYWVLDPYVRARSYYDRIGVLKPGGKLDFYPSEKPATTATITNGTPAVIELNATSADDVD